MGRTTEDCRIVLRPYNPAEAISIADAARRAGIGETTAREWCSRYALGRKSGGHWRVSIIALEMHLDGDEEALALYHAGELQHERVRAYYARLNVPVPMAGTNTARTLATAGFANSAAKHEAALGQNGGNDRVL